MTISIIFYDAIMGTLKMSSQSLMSNCKHPVVPGWNDKVKGLHSAALDACLIWRAIGKPIQPNQNQDKGVFNMESDW